jgi:diguanylate cyclase (GGDEF)-like protein
MSGEEVLVVEDSLVVRASLRQQLQARGFVVMEAEDGAGALRAADDAPPDVILLDVELPGMDGYEVLDHLKASDRLRHIPVVFLTGRTDSGEMVRAMASGAHDYLRKPFESAELIARIEAAVRQKSAQDELRQRVGELDRAARIDALTGLYNRRELDERLAGLASHGRRNGIEIGVLLVDVDRFKQINDTLGHATGDAVLQEIATRLRAEVRAEDVVGRWGGEEFLLLAPGSDLKGRQQLAERLRRAVADGPITTPDGQRLAVTISVGCAGGPADDPGTVLAMADAAMYGAKAAGRNVVACWCSGAAPIVLDQR